MISLFDDFARDFATKLTDGRVVTWGEADYGGDSNAVQAQLQGVRRYHLILLDRSNLQK